MPRTVNGTGQDRRSRDVDGPDRRAQVEDGETAGDAKGGEQIEKGFVGPVPWTEDYVI